MYNIGVDLGGTNIAVGVVNENYEIVKKISIPTLAKRSSDEIADDLIRAVEDVISLSGIEKKEIESIGIAAPGTINRNHRDIDYVCSLPFIEYPICDRVSKATGIEKVTVENDANAAALGEAFAGAARGTKNSVMITLGTGVGGGIIIDGKIFAGFNNAGAELGHMVIVQGGEPCSCGRRGCWESYSSATALVRMTKEKMIQRPDSVMWELVGSPDKVSGRTSFEAARRNDEAGKEVVDEYLSYLACGLCNIINIFQPEILSIGGGISNEKSDLINPLEKIIRGEEYGSRIGVKREYTLLKIAELKNDAGIIGAALLCRQ